MTLSGLRDQALTHKAVQSIVLHFVNISQAFGLWLKYVLPKAGLFLIKRNRLAV